MGELLVAGTNSMQVASGEGYPGEGYPGRKTGGNSVQFLPCKKWTETVGHFGQKPGLLAGWLQGN